MIALLTTYFLVFYILIPGILFRFVTSWFVPLKLFERTRAQEATFAVAVAFLPFAVALFGVWYLPVMKQYPFPVAQNSSSERTEDYRRVTGILTASDASKLLLVNSTAGLSSANESNWQSLNRVLRRQARFLAWYFLAIAIEGWLFGASARKYGDWLSRPGRCRRRLWFARTFVLPNISEWHLLLSDFSWPRRQEIFVSVDILQRDGHLYQGQVADYFVDSTGQLTGILLEHVSRFDRQTYLDTKNDSRETKAVSPASFWKNIPSRHFYVGEPSISNLNVRFVPKDETLISLAEDILDGLNTRVEARIDARVYDVTVGSQDDPGYSNPKHPDLYS